MATNQRVLLSLAHVAKALPLSTCYTVPDYATLPIVIVFVENLRNWMRNFQARPSCSLLVHPNPVKGPERQSKPVEQVRNY